MTIAEEKKRLRKKMLSLRAGLTGNQVASASAACLERIISLPAFREQEWIYVYLSFRNEMDTLSMLDAFWSEGKRLAVPRIEGKDMHFYEIKSLGECRPGTMGILEPAWDPVKDQSGERITESGLMLMPGLAFDHDHHRLGFGGGFYDRYLAQHRNLVTAGICYDFQIVSHVPNEPYDLCPEVLVSDLRVL